MIVKRCAYEAWASCATCGASAFTIQPRWIKSGLNDYSSWNVFADALVVTPVSTYITALARVVSSPMVVPVAGSDELAL